MIKTNIESNETEYELTEDENNTEISETEINKNNDEDNKTNEVIDLLKHQIAELEEKFLRSVAEVDNTRKRYEKIIQETKEYAITNFSAELLTILDNLNLALNHKNDVDKLISGVEMTQQALINIFKKQGILEIIPQLGDKFDYNIHNAISQVMTSEHENDTIVNVMQPGYKLRERLLRPAIVSVAKN